MREGGKTLCWFFDMMEASVSTSEHTARAATFHSVSSEVVASRHSLEGKLKEVEQCGGQFCVENIISSLWDICGFHFKIME